MEYYWELVLKDGTTVLIPPQGVVKVNKHLQERTPIVTRSQTIMANDVQTFRVTNKAVNPVPLLESAAQAFSSAEYNEDGSIVSRWVKKNVTHREYSSNYSKLPGYHRVGDDASQVWVAMLLPVHMIEPQNIWYCSDEEVERLERERNPHVT